VKKFGVSQKIVPFIEEASAGDKMASCISLIDYFCFKLVSPSRLEVSTKAIPFGLELLRRMRSAGN
jgi:hypothetical protein